MANGTVALRLPPGADSPPVTFGVAELGRALADAGYTLSTGAVDLEIGVGVASRHGPAAPGAARPARRAEAYSVSRAGEGRLALVGHDDVGAMYACLDLAEQLAMGAELEEIEDRDAAPELAVRGIYRFLHNEEAERDWVYDREYWERYADELARCRYNRFNLIYGHQTAYLIPIYGHLLEDLDEEFPEIRVRDVTAEERGRNLDVLQTASEAMVNRGLTFFLGIWQSRPWTVVGGEREDQPTRVTGTEDLRLLAEYTRQGFTRLVERCPHIGGVQLRMNVESGVADQRFFVQSFVPALRDLAARGRPLKVELRNWALQPETVEAFRQAGLDIVVSTKYFAEHQGLPYQPPAMRGSYSYDSFLRKDKPFPFQWHLWNLGTHRLFAWGDPDYARRFALSCHLGDGVGFEVTPPGSQKGFSQWGQVGPGDWQPRSDLPPRRDFERYWFFLLAFGRAGYDPTTPYSVYLHQLAKRTSPEAAPALLSAYRAASRVVSYLISMRMDDPNMYVWPELDCGGPIDHNAIARPGEVTLFANAREHARDRVAGRVSAKRSPFDAAQDLERYASNVEEALAQTRLEPMPSLAESEEFRTIKTDFEALRALARYHAAKCRATGNLALFYESGERRYLDSAEADAESAIRRWDELCARTEVYYDKLHFGPSGGHWRDNKPRVQYDLRRIRRVREIFDRRGLFSFGFDFGQAFAERAPDLRIVSGLEPEPRFIGVDAGVAYSAERGYGWLGTGGLRAQGFARLPRTVIWGVHYVTPSVESDPADVEAMPLDGLTNRYLTAPVQRTFRIDVSNGEYEVTLIGPREAPVATPVRLDDGSDRPELALPLLVGGVAPSVARSSVTVTKGTLELIVGGDEPWALAGAIVRRVEPEIAHLPPVAIRGWQDLRLTATATGVGGGRSTTLRYRSGSDWKEVKMDGDGTAFRVTVPRGELVGETFEYEFVATDEDSRQTRRGGFGAPVVRGFRPPRVVEVSGPETWSAGDELRFSVTFEDGEFLREVRLHYGEADQNRELLTATMVGGEAGEYVFEVEGRQLDDAYELLYYFEVIDVFGHGTFYPDPFEQARYFISRPG